MKYLFLWVTASCISFSGYAQKGLGPILQQIKVEMERDTTLGYSTEKYRFNPCRFEFHYNEKKGEIQVIRIKIPEPGFTDISNNKEIRTVKLALLDATSISVSGMQYGYTLNVQTKNKVEKVEFRLDTGTIMNNFLGFGIHNYPNAEDKLHRIAELLKSAIEIIQQK